MVANAGARSAFQNLDADKSGALERPEIVALLSRLGVSVAEFKEVGKSLGDIDVDKLFAEIDEDGGGDISCEEFVGWWKATWCKVTDNKRMNEATVAAAKKCFEELDDDSSDSLDRGEMVQLLRRLGVNMPNEPAPAPAPASVTSGMSFKMAGQAASASVKMTPAGKREAKKLKAKKAAANARVGAWARGQEEVSKFLQGVDVDALFKEIDTDGGGDISMEEFMGWYSGMFCRVTQAAQMDDATRDGATPGWQLQIV